jgi:hypothetical protein
MQGGEVLAQWQSGYDLFPVIAGSGPESPEDS